ncbi:hypothetical protein AVEN_152622-1 [Araneus ventricosus]|uniref:Uncharacterized protein n=1 Tax=Araneus ventricosus TaxID=182803 RepID=A0A4Y2FSK4_ARAVE|nr:hypothetical protein AVEN_152622-1 [Araneus ventricosus]
MPGMRQIFTAIPHQNGSAMTSQNWRGVERKVGYPTCPNIRLDCRDINAKELGVSMYAWMGMTWVLWFTRPMEARNRRDW